MAPSCPTNCADWIGDQFQPKKICPRDENPALFVTTQWSRSQGWYVLYRMAMATLLTAWAVWDYYSETLVFYAPHYGLWFVFATDWAFLSQVVSDICHAILILHYHIGSCCHTSCRGTEEKEKEEQKQEQEEQEQDTKEDPSSLVDNGGGKDTHEGHKKQLPLKYQFYWVLYTTSLSNSLVVCFSYWSFILAVSHEKALEGTSSKVKHSLMAGLVLLDLLFDSVPLRLLHVVYPLLSGTVYVIFTVIYYFAGGRGPDAAPGIYPVLAWESPGQALTTIGLEFLLTILIFCVAVAIYRIRVCLQSCCQCCGCERNVAGPERNANDGEDGQGGCFGFVGSKDVSYLESSELLTRTSSTQIGAEYNSFRTSGS